ncbi:c-type cytochrome [Pseudomonas putida]|uniref:c-type cytochrome n=1 Tax=Pseudomonas putida TaxID=303 RepID=UPI0021F8F885|nr:c-type cytochrome [Pseudomonas putida]
MFDQSLVDCRNPVINTVGLSSVALRDIQRIDSKQLKKSRLWMYLPVIMAFLLGEPTFAQDVPPGSAVFNQRCGACHVSGKPSAMGPDLAGVFGRKAGTLANFTYSSAMRDSQRVWNEAELDAFIQNPQKAVKGTKMFAPGISDAKIRSDLITYLQTLE